MNGRYTFWFPSVCTLMGAIFTAAQFFLQIFFAFVRSDLYLPLLKDIAKSSRCHREVQREVRALRTALTPLGEATAQMLDGHRRLTTDLQALAEATREITDIMRSLHEVQAPVAPVLFDILAELRNTQGGPQIQGRLGAFSLRDLLFEILSRLKPKSW
jgi:hypothetical protein